MLITNIGRSIINHILEENKWGQQIKDKPMAGCKNQLTLFWTGGGGKKAPQVNSAIWSLRTMKLGRNTV